jgi:hypothetical protein
MSKQGAKAYDREIRKTTGETFARNLYDDFYGPPNQSGTYNQSVGAQLASIIYARLGKDASDVESWYQADIGSGKVMLTFVFSDGTITQIEAPAMHDLQWFVEELDLGWEFDVDFLS